MSKITLQTPVADIVTIIPRAADLFRQLRIDYCCGGKESLELAAIERKLDPKQVLEDHKMKQSLSDIFSRSTMHFFAMSCRS